MIRDVKRVLISERRIKSAIRRMARSIQNDYSGRDLTVVAILNGSLIFLADLLRELTLPLTFDCIMVGSYKGGTKSSGQIRFLSKLKLDVRNRNVLIIDDIFDTGLTLSRVHAKILKMGAKEVKSAVLLYKMKPRSKVVEPDYSALQIHDEFVVGYGLDYAEKYRNLPYIAVLKETVIKRKQ